jgi:peptide/nickel transport system permease protein
MVDAIFQRDYPVVQGAALVIAFLYVLVNTLTDISYAYLDPRLRRS